MADWTIANNNISSGSFLVQSGTGSPLNGFSVLAPTDGSFAAMADQGGPGARVIYQDFVVSSSVSVAILSFDYFISNQNGNYFNPGSLDPNISPNQHARVDLMLPVADAFSTAGSDILLNIYQNQAGDPAVMGYTTLTTDVTSILAAHAGQTLRLRFAEADNQFFFNMGVDRVSLTARTADVPEPGAVALLIGTGLTGGLFLRRRRK